MMIKRCAFGEVTFSGAHSRKMGSILHFVNPNFVQAQFGPKSCERRLKFCIQHLNVIFNTNQEHNLGSEVNDLHYDFHQFRKMGKYQLVHTNSFISAWPNNFKYFKQTYKTCANINTDIRPPVWPHLNYALEYVKIC